MSTKRTSTDAALPDQLASTPSGVAVATNSSASTTTRVLSNGIEALLTWNGGAELARVPPLPLETLRLVQRKLAHIKLLVDDAARRAAAPSAALAALQLVVNGEVRSYERTKVFKLSFEAASGELKTCEEARDPRAKAARAAIANGIVAQAMRIAGHTEQLPTTLVPQRPPPRFSEDDKESVAAAGAAGENEGSASASTAATTTAATAVAAAGRKKKVSANSTTATAAAAAGPAIVPTVHASNFVELERTCDVAFDFAPARVALRAVLYYRRALASETIHYRIWYGTHTEPRNCASTDVAIESVFALLQRPIASRKEEERECAIFEWFAVRSFETDGVRQVQYLPETFMRRQDTLIAARRVTTQFDPPSYAAQCVGHVAMMLANIDVLIRRSQNESLIAVLESQGAAALGRELVLRMLQLVPELRVWNVIEQDVDACFGLAPTQQTVTHSARIKQAGVDYNT
jgi:hypothetical protein